VCWGFLPKPLFNHTWGAMPKKNLKCGAFLITKKKYRIKKANSLRHRLTTLVRAASYSSSGCHLWHCLRPLRLIIQIYFFFFSGKILVIFNFSPPALAGGQEVFVYENTSCCFSKNNPKNNPPKFS
jgi:hypothetical protein